MPDAVKLRVGAEVLATDGEVGTLSGIVLTSDALEAPNMYVRTIHPGTLVVSHLHVQSLHHKLNCFVPINAVSSTDRAIHLSWARRQYDQLEPGSALEKNFAGASFGFLKPGPWGSPPRENKDVTHLAAADDEFDLQRQSNVHATDGNIGQFDGLVFDSDTHHVTHFLFAEGHFLGKRVVAFRSAPRPRSTVTERASH